MFDLSIELQLFVRVRCSLLTGLMESIPTSLLLPPIHIFSDNIGQLNDFGVSGGRGRLQLPVRATADQVPVDDLVQKSQPSFLFHKLAITTLKVRRKREANEVGRTQE